MSTIILVNLKCGFSTCEDLVKHCHLIRLNMGYDNKRLNPQVVKQLWITKKLTLMDLPVYIIVRNPISRILSFYQDKFVKNKVEDGKILWQDCQKNMLKHVPRVRILSGQFSFSEFVQAIKKGYWDAHIEQQSNLYQLYSPTHSVKLLKMDSPDFSEKLAEILKISPQSIPKTNETKSEDKLSSIKPEDREYLKKKYEKDFKIFGY